MSKLERYVQLSDSLIEAARRTEAELGDKISSVLMSIKSIKDEMLDLEKRINVEEQPERIRLSLLKRKSGELNELSDSMVLTSRDAWMKFNNLAQRCEGEGGDPALLGPVRILCKKIDVIAADLLCFSLGH